MSDHNESKRKFLKTAVYTAPVLMTLQVTPALARSGSSGGIREVPPAPRTGGTTPPPEIREV